MKNAQKATSVFREPSKEDPHRKFWEHIVAGGKVWRDDPRNNEREWLDLDRLGGDPNEIRRYGYNNLSIPLSQPEHQPIFASIAVTGRIPGRDEDCTFVFGNASRDEAEALFEGAIYESEPEGARDLALHRHGKAVFVTNLLVSDSPIRFVDDPIPAPPPLPRVLALVTSGGVLETYADPGVDLVEFDWMNYLAESAEGKHQMTLPARFADLAPDDTPIEDPVDPAAFIFKDTRPDGENTLVEATFGYYRDGSPVINLRELATGDPYATCTVAWKTPAPAGAGVDGKHQQTVWIRDYDEMTGITKLLVDSGILDREWADAHSSMPGDPCPQLLTARAMLALARCEQPKPIKKPVASLGM